MSASRRESPSGRNRPSKAQRCGSAGMVQVMHLWEDLSDQERLAWEVHAAQRRLKTVNDFKRVNLRRAGRGQELARVPPRPMLYDPRPLLRDLHIRNRGGRITLELQLQRVPDSPRTVWASLPCNRGLKNPRRCPRLGWLPATSGRWCEITKLYFEKHGEHIQHHGLELVGKRIFVRIRLETDDGPNLFEQVKALVPRPEVEMDKKGRSPSKEHRRIIERPSKGHRNITWTTRGRHAPAAGRQPATA